MISREVNGRSAIVQPLLRAALDRGQHLDRLAFGAACVAPIRRAGRPLPRPRPRSRGPRRRRRPRAPRRRPSRPRRARAARRSARPSSAADLGGCSRRGSAANAAATSAPASISATCSAASGASRTPLRKWPVASTRPSIAPAADQRQVVGRPGAQPGGRLDQLQLGDLGQQPVGLAQQLVHPAGGDRRVEAALLDRRPDDQPAVGARHQIDALRSDDPLADRVRAGPRRVRI